MLKNKLLKNSSTLFLGTLIAFAVSFAFNAYFRRILSDEFFANYEVVFRLSSILAVVFSARYGMALVTPEKDEQAFSLFWGANGIALVSGVLTFLAIFLFESEIALWLGLDNTSYLYFVPVISLVMALNQNLNFLFTRLKKFKEQSLFKLFHRFGEGGVVISLIGFIGHSLLILGDLLGRVLISLFGYIILVKKEKKVFNTNLSSIKAELIRHKEYPLYNALPSLLNTISLMLPMLLINKHYSDYETSKVGLSFQVLAIPLSLLVSSISQVILQRVSQDRTEGRKIGKDVLQLFWVLLISALLGIVTITFFGEDLFSFVFGESYAVSGYYAKVLVFSIAIKLIVSPFSVILPALNKIKLGSYWQLFYFCGVLTLYLQRDIIIESFIVYLVGVEVIAYSVYGGIIIKQIFKYNKSKRLV